MHYIKTFYLILCVDFYVDLASCTLSVQETQYRGDGITRMKPGNKMVRWKDEELLNEDNV